MVDYIKHYGVKGMKQGVRRYQNEDGTWTDTGKRRRVYGYRVKNASRTKNDMDSLYNRLSQEDKRLLGDDKGSREWLTTNEGEYVVKRFIMRHGNEPVSALDIMTTTRDGHLTLAIFTDPSKRGTGQADKLVKKAVRWYDKNANRLGCKTLGWGAYANNKASRRLAEKNGFIYNPKASTDEWSVYNYYDKRRTK